MNLGQLKKRCKLAVPNVKTSGIDDDALADLINYACDAANLLAKVYKGYTDFDIVAEKQIYNLSSVAPLYLGSDKRGAYFKDSNDKWQDVIPKTEAWLRRVNPDYLNSSSTAIPQWYWVDGDELGFQPKPSTAKTSGARIYHLKKASPMSTDGTFPFSGNATELVYLRPLDDAIIAYVKWKLSPSFGKVTDSDLGEREFISECQKAAKQIKRRRDLTHDSGYGVKT